MENFGLKGLFVTLYQRVILSWKSTLLGFGIALLGTAVDYVAQSPNKIVSTIFVGIGIVLALVKEKIGARTSTDPDPAS